MDIAGLSASVLAPSHRGTIHSPPASQEEPGGIQDPAERKELAELRQRDREVRAHEQAHVSAAGSLAQGAPKFELAQGPDGRSYAVGGEVQIQLREGKTPEETVRLARQAQRAALAPANPSAQDRAVAAEAAAMATRAQAEAHAEQPSAGSQESPEAGGLVSAFAEDLLVSRVHGFRQA